MQTKRQIQQLLSSAGIEPNKRLGQHFLIDLNLMRLLLDSAALRKNDVVLEVGCGTGSLTQELAERAGMVLAVEYDRTLAKIARRQLSGFKNVMIFNIDVLKNKNTITDSITEAMTLAKDKYNGRVLLVSNLPYNVASSVMMNLVTGPVKANGMYVTVQREVAERMAAGPGSKDYGILSIFLSVSGQVKIMRVLKTSVFWPQPQVESAMISFVRDEEKLGQIHDIEIFKDVVNLFMGHHRKMLKACSRLTGGKLKEIHEWAAIFADCAIEPHKRGEELSPENYIAIANLCTEYLRTK